MLAISSPLQQFFDLDGTPLDDGRLYFGIANANPETNPITVYWDAAGTQPAAQPIQTLNGYPARNGAIGTVYAAADYSLTVRTRKGQLVRYVATSIDTSNDLALLAEIAALEADYASTAAGKGASLVGIQDAGNYFTGTTAEAAFQQLGNAAFRTPWFITKESEVLMSLRHATSGNIVQQWQDGSPGTATYFYRGLSIQTNSHSIQMGPATNGGSCDLLWERSVLNADPAGNRFNLTFDEANDRLLHSYATTASGSPSFDTAMSIVAGTSPALTFPGIAAQFNQGVGVKQRPAGGFECRFVPSSSTIAEIKQIGGSGTTYLTFRDGAMGFFGSTGTSRPTITGSRGGNAALANLLTFLNTLGLITDSTTA